MQITDVNAATIKTKAGILPTSGTTKTIVFDPDTSVANSIHTFGSSPDGTNNPYDIVFDFSEVNFTAAGVYRYVITETVDTTTKAKAGITDTTDGSTRYLDVYVRDHLDTDTSNGRQIYGYVLSNTNSAITSSTSGKTVGFLDEYHTFDLTVKKTLVNDQAQETHQFPFTVTLSNDTITANLLIDATVNDSSKVSFKNNTSPSVTTISTASPTVSEVNIAHGGSVTYKGIPAGTHISVYEINDVTGTTYNSSFKVNTGALSDAKNITWDSTGDANKSNVANKSTDPDRAYTNQTIEFVNTTELISPTGVALRFAPYIIMAIAATFLMIIARRKKDNDTGYAI